MYLSFFENSRAYRVVGFVVLVRSVEGKSKTDSSLVDDVLKA